MRGLRIDRGEAIAKKDGIGQQVGRSKERDVNFARHKTPFIGQRSIEKRGKDQIRG